MTNDQLYFEMWSELGEPQGGAKFSVYDITRGLNFVLRTVGNNLPRSASELKEYVVLPVSSGEATLPADFLAAKSVWNGGTKLKQVIGDEDVDAYTYDIYGDTLVTATSITSLKLYYKKQFTQLVTDGTVPTGNFPLPDFYIDMVKKYAIAYLTGSIDNLTELIAKDARYLGAGRDKTTITPRQSFYI